ncbi:hypothetical protein [Sphingomonas sp. PB4P5]|uniref:hypothetical protein n=1 Tax=Parasphingomonas puruogangriensis TaxID=3096155 RepID=UPI002FC751E8
MARTTLTLSAHFTPAFYELLNTAEAIKERHGPDRATEWAHKAMEIDFDLFCSIRSDRRPSLRVIRGGAA